MRQRPEKLLPLPVGPVISQLNDHTFDRLTGNLIFDNILGNVGDWTYDAENPVISAAGGGLNKYVYEA